jgi:hypothetical protein
VSRCPQAAILRCATATEPALLLSAEGLDIHVWQLGSALDRQNQVIRHCACRSVHSCMCKLLSPCAMLGMDGLSIYVRQLDCAVIEQWLQPHVTERVEVSKACITRRLRV